MPQPEDLRELGALLEEATKTGQVHAIALRRALRKFHEMQEPGPAPISQPRALAMPPRKIPAPLPLRPRPPLPVPGPLGDFDEEEVPTEEELLQQMIDAGLVEG